MPGQTIYMDMQYEFNANWLFSMQNYWISDSKRQLGDTRPEVADFLKTDVTLIWEPGQHWHAKLSIRNLFDDDIREPTPDNAFFGLVLGFPDDIEMESRSIYGSVVYSF